MPPKQRKRKLSHDSNPAAASDASAALSSATSTSTAANTPDLTGVRFERVMGGARGYADGNALREAKFEFVGDMTYDRWSKCYLLADAINRRIRVFDPIKRKHGSDCRTPNTECSAADMVGMYAGNGVEQRKDGAAADASFYRPLGLAVHPIDGSIVVADYYAVRRIVREECGHKQMAEALSGHLIRDLIGIVLSYLTERWVETIAGCLEEGFVDGVGKNARFNRVSSIAISPSGVVFCVDEWNHRIRSLTQRSDGVWVVATVAGNGKCDTVDGNALSAALRYPHSLCFSPIDDSVVYIAGNAAVRVLDLRSPRRLSTLRTERAVDPTDLIVTPDGSHIVLYDFSLCDLTVVHIASGRVTCVAEFFRALPLCWAAGGSRDGLFCSVDNNMAVHKLTGFPKHWFTPPQQQQRSS